MRKNLVLDIGTYRIKLIYGFFSNGIVVAEKAASMLSPEGIIDNGQLNVETATAALTYLLTSLDLGKGLFGMSVVESTSIVMRNLSFPYSSPEDLNNMVQMEIQRLFSEVLSNYMVDYTCLNIRDNDENNGKVADVMVFALPESVYQSYFDMFENCDVRQNVLDVLQNSTGRILRQRTFINEELCSPEGTFAFVDMGHTTTSIIIVSKGVLAFSRTLQRAGMNITEGIAEALNVDFPVAEKIKEERADVTARDQINETIIAEVDEIIGEVQRVFRYYLSNQGSNGSIDKIFIYGGTSRIRNLDTYMSQSFGIQVSYIESTNFINLKHTLPLDCIPSDYINAAAAMMRI